MAQSCTHTDQSARVLAVEILLGLMLFEHKAKQELECDLCLPFWFNSLSPECSKKKQSFPCWSVLKWLRGTQREREREPREQ